MDEHADARADGAGRPAAFFDLDKTIIAKSSTLAFGRSFYNGGLINRRTVLRTAYAQFVYLAGGADHDQMERMRQFLSAMATGWDVEQVKEIVGETLYDLIDPLIYSEAAALIAEHKAAGRDVVIVSTSGSEVVEPIAEMLGADLAIGTRMAVGEDGKYSGEIEFYAYAENKAKAIMELAAERGYDLKRSFAYSDSATDIPMLESVGHPYAVNPDRALRKEATVREWPILVFDKPVALRSRVGELAAKPAVSGTALGLALATAGTIWWLGTRGRRRRRYDFD
ncbi:HAD-IB family hydrolase [Catenulispora sp. NF23]|uniref:HAD-IB family hydrolase n=1 Tax=Catenulispora pinistramenti TaxID=2705254 RepID=A0ABS5KIS7_9ACTN|nr:HAD-IB family hydrolase [Catenulispora pinistramenti]MBS2531310.1 HAD-IB family hydrolase [Catenulispora pinistramenti]MBS2545992.1 HAD-IB family hydrolase [Catenulispora pinistramenti]